MGYDYKYSPRDFITTHAQALNFHKGFNIIGGVDLSSSYRHLFEEKFKKQTSNDYLEFIEKFSPDIIVISTPTESHYDIFHKINEIYNPKIYLIEKPLAYSIIEMKKMTQIFKDNTKVAINYFRQYDPTFNKISNYIKSGKLGFPIKIIINYNKGILNNGSHFINYISNFMGQFLSLDLINHKKSSLKYDFEPDLCIKYENGAAFMIAHEDERFSYLQMEIVGANGKIVFENFGDSIYQYNITQDPNFSSFNILSNKPNIFKPQINKYQLYVYENVYRHLNENQNILCDGNSLSQTNEILKAIITGINKNEK